MDFLQKIKKQGRNRNKLHKGSTVKDDNKQSANESRRKERIKNYTKPPGDPT